jgi:nicotinate-nucleotide adenylyltransferase
VRLGVLGGTFNPPHLGHLAAARQARRQLRLERVLLMPGYTPPHKPSEEEPGAERRLAMCELIARGEPGLEACALEIRRGGPSYTVDTLRELHELHPDARFTLIVGADMARTLPGWREAPELFRLATVAVADREGVDRGEVAAELRRAGAGASFLSMPPVAVSSSLVRERAAAGAPIEELVGPAVANYIEHHGLYRAAAPLDAVARAGSPGPVRTL